VNRDKYVIECWAKLYSRLSGSTYALADWPDKDSSKEAIDAIYQDDSGITVLGIEHTLIQPFKDEKADTVRFTETLAALENHPDLIQKGYLVEVSQPVGAVQKGVDWAQVRGEQLRQLKTVLPTLKGEGHRCVTVKVKGWSFELLVSKLRIDPANPGKVLVGRTWPGDPGPELIVKALEDKVPKLAAFVRGKRILLLEKDAIAGTIEQQFRRLPHDSNASSLLQRIDEVWTTNTVSLETDGVIFTNQLWPDLRAHTCSLNLRTGSFWQKAH